MKKIPCFNGKGLPAIAMPPSLVAHHDNSRRVLGGLLKQVAWQVNSFGMLTARMGKFRQFSTVIGLIRIEEFPMWRKPSRVMKKLCKQIYNLMYN